MQVADTITGWVPDSSPSTTVLIDELSPDYSQPRDDRTLGGSLDVSAISSEQVGGWTTIQFTRKLITGDGYDYNIGSSDLKLLYAIGRRDGWATQICFFDLLIAYLILYVPSLSSVPATHRAIATNSTTRTALQQSTSPRGMPAGSWGTRPSTRQGPSSSSLFWLSACASALSATA